MEGMRPEGRNINMGYKEGDRSLYQSVSISGISKLFWEWQCDFKCRSTDRLAELVTDCRSQLTKLQLLYSK